MMRQLGRIVRYAFGLEAFVFVAAPLWMVVHLLTSPHPARHPAALLVIPVGLLFGGLPGLAWWTLRKGKRWARAWALAASVLNLAIGSLLLPTHQRFPLLRLTGLLGIAGLVAFWRKSSVQGPAQQPPPKVERIAGDGTSRTSEHIAQAAGFLCFFAGAHFWSAWGLDRQLPRVGFVWLLVQLQVAGLIAVACHEAGHVLAGWHGGMRLRTFQVGPFFWKILNGHWTFQFRLRKFDGGLAGMVSSSLDSLRERTAVMTLGGPVASLVVGAVAWLAALAVAGSPWQPIWEILAMLSLVSTTAFVVNMIPQKPGSHYSDGAACYQLLKNGPWAKVNLALGMVGSTLVTATRPRDWDLSTIESAADFVASGERGMHLRWFVSMCHMDRGQLAEASAHAQAAEALFEGALSEDPRDLLAEFIFFDAVFRQDKESAERWWLKLEVLPVRKNDVEHCRAHASILMLRGDFAGAREACERGYALALKLPPCGAYNCTRDSFQALRGVLGAGERVPLVA